MRRLGVSHTTFYNRAKAGEWEKMVDADGRVRYRIPDKVDNLFREVVRGLTMESGEAVKVDNPPARVLDSVGEKCDNTAGSQVDRALDKVVNLLEESYGARLDDSQRLLEAKDTIIEGLNRQLEAANGRLIALRERERLPAFRRESGFFERLRQAFLG